MSIFERRKFERHTTQINACVGKSACIILNLSDDGALLEMLDDVQLPYTFKLTANGHEVWCETRHYERNRVGVHFLRPVLRD